jgi:uncharacterized protein YdaU (DUF1376 family)
MTKPRPKTGLPWIPYYVSDWAHATVHMTAAERGVFIRLIEHYWPIGRLPCDEVKLQRIAGVTPEEWVKVAPEVLAMFDTVNGELRHRMLDKLRKSAESKVKQAQAAGRKSAKARKTAQRTLNESKSFNESESESEPELEPESESHTLCAPSASECEQFWQAFWQAFPHTNQDNPKEKARHEFDKAVKKVPPEKIIEGAKRYAGEINRSTKLDKWRYVPQTWKWIAEKRWADDPSDPSKHGRGPMRLAAV